MTKNGNGLFRPSPNGQQEVNLTTMLSKYLQFWYLFVISIGISVAIAYFHIRYIATPEYSVSSTLLIKDDAETGVFSGAVSGGINDIGANKNIGSQMLVLGSRNLMQRVLSELDFHTGYFVEGRFKDVEVYKRHLPFSLIVSKMDSTAYGKSIKLSFEDNNIYSLVEYDQEGKEIVSKYKLGQEINKPYATFTVIGSSELASSKNIIVNFYDIRQLAESYSQRLVIELENKDANVLRLSLTDPLPERSKLILGKLVEVYNKEGVEDKTQVELSTINFLDERIQYLSNELSDVEKNVEQYKQENKLTDISSNAEMYLQSAQEYDKELEKYELQIEILSSLQGYVAQGEAKLIPSSLNIEDPSLNGLIAKLNELQLERQRMLRTIQPNSSIIVNIDDQLASFKSNITENIKSLQNALVLTRDNLQASSRQFQSKIWKVPSNERRLMEINRQQGIKQEIYLYLLQKREEAGLALASAAPNSRIIDSAIGRDFPTSPKKSAIYLAALMIGFLVPTAFVYIRDLVNTRVSDKGDIEYLTQAPILGEILRSTEKLALQVTEGKNTIIAESFRMIRANLHFATLGKDNKVILVTSSSSGEGKTFFSINLASSLALSGKKVVLLGFDLRKPKLLRHLGVSSKIGITDYLVTNDLSIDSLILPVSTVSDLYVIGEGTTVPNPAELMMSQKIKQLISELKERFDYIIVDTAPVGIVADAYNLTDLVDSSIYIIRDRYTFKTQLAIIEDIYLNKKLANPMIVYNDAKKKKGYTYGYGN